MSAGTGSQATLDEALWRAAVAKVVKTADSAALRWRTADGLEFEPLYRAYTGEAQHVSDLPVARWRLVQRLEHPDPSHASAQALEDVIGGAGGLAIVAKAAPAAHGFGVHLERQGALEQVLAGVDPWTTAIRIEPGPEGVQTAALVVAWAEGRGHALRDLTLDLGIDPVTTLATAGILPMSWPDTALRMASMLEDLRARGFSGHAFAADSRPWHEAGASEAQELAGVLASGVLTLRALEKGGVELDAAREAVSFTLAADTDLVLSISKFRALRRLWARVEAACGLVPKPLHLHGETAWRTMTRAAPQTNIVRGTLACFAAAVGGADAITVLPYSAAHGLADAIARRIARNTHHVLAEEANLWRATDPAAGAGLFEAVTEALCRAAWAEFQAIEREGGAVESLAGGAVQARVAAVRVEREARVADGRDPLVGTTIFLAEDAPTPVLAEARQVSARSGVGPLVATPFPAPPGAEAFEKRREGA